jgi:hypothetical protein
MAIVRQYGKPDLFITMTCNPKWEEIVSMLKLGGLLMTALIWSHAFLLANYSTCWTSF